MKKEDIYGLKYYLIFSVVLIGFFVYSGMTGYRWFNPTKTEPHRPAGGSGYAHRYYYHK